MHNQHTPASAARSKILEGQLDGEKVCWMNGMAGTGKTMITNTLCSILDQSNELSASFFCTRSIPACRDVKLILPTIHTSSRGSPIHSEAHYCRFWIVIQMYIPRCCQCNLNTWYSEPAGIVVVVDALDECEYSDGAEQYWIIYSRAHQTYPSSSHIEQTGVPYSSRITKSALKT
ncbi:hypothetical protein B0J17DRAFT_245872 [Rhizoctonia solani]|nr:hypothetical protein B0J17DRAFT_245872 [Rhizoctonia solani]